MADGARPRGLRLDPLHRLTSGHDVNVEHAEALRRNELALAYQDGAKARRQGKSVEACPEYLTEAYAQRWRDGWASVGPE